MSKCEYENEKGHCILNECMYGDFLERDDSRFNTGYPFCFKPNETVVEKIAKDMHEKYIKEQNDN